MKSDWRNIRIYIFCLLSVCVLEWVNTHVQTNGIIMTHQKKKACIYNGNFFLHIQLFLYKSSAKIMMQKDYIMLSSSHHHHPFHNCTL